MYYKIAAALPSNALNVLVKGHQSSLNFEFYHDSFYTIIRPGLTLIYRESFSLTHVMIPNVSPTCGTHTMALQCHLLRKQTTQCGHTTFHSLTCTQTHVEQLNTLTVTNKGAHFDIILRAIGNMDASFVAIWAMKFAMSKKPAGDNCYERRQL